MSSNSHFESVTCIKCGAELIAAKSARLRCARCGNVNEQNYEAGIERDHMAWRSLWLGISSLILMFFTGIPAIYLGVKSLIRARQQETRTKDKRAAIGGIALGTFFSCFGLCVSGLAATVIFSLLTATETRDPQMINAIVDNFTTIDMPENVVPEVAETHALSSSLCNFCDKTNPNETTVRVTIAHYDSTLRNDTNGMSRYLRRRIHHFPNESESEKEILEWELNGKQSGVVKAIHKMRTDKPELSNREYHQYYSYTKGQMSLLGLSVIVRRPDCTLTEDEIREIFASVKLVNQDEN